MTCSPSLLRTQHGKDVNRQMPRAKSGITMGNVQRQSFRPFFPLIPASLCNYAIPSILQNKIGETGRWGLSGALFVCTQVLCLVMSW